MLSHARVSTMRDWGAQQVRVAVEVWQTRLALGVLFRELVVWYMETSVVDYLRGLAGWTTQLLHKSVGDRWRRHDGERAAEQGRIIIE